MNRKVGRNDPCPCGSGKKFKRCCGDTKVVSISQIMDEEITQLQMEMIEYAVTNYEEQLFESFSRYEQSFEHVPDEDQELYFLIHTIWFAMSVVQTNGGTIFEEFIEERRKTVKRPRLQSILQSWRNGKIVAGNIASLKNKYVTFTDLLRNKTYEAYVLDEISEADNTFLFGFLLPYESKHTFFMTCFSVPKTIGHRYEAILRDMYEGFGEANPDKFFEQNFFELFIQWSAILDRIPIEEMPWDEEIYQEVALLYKEKMNELGIMNGLVIDYGVILWYEFCKRRPKRIKNKALYAASIHYLVDSMIFFGDGLTQKELASIYGVSAGSISSVYNEIFDVVVDLIEKMDSFEDDEFSQDISPQFVTSKQNSPLETERAIYEMTKASKEREFADEAELSAFLTERLHTQLKQSANYDDERDHAQHLIFDAFEASGNKRYHLAEQALKIYPNMADAYNILAEKASSLDEAAALYEQGVRVGRVDLGASFFKENQGHFWGMIETRGFMRAKFNYGQAILALGKREQAVEQFEELLSLNPADNQGVRDVLIGVYIEMKYDKKASELLDLYEESSAFYHYSRLLIELLNNGATRQAEKLYQEAKKQNPFVDDYINGVEKLPNNPPAYYGFGDENEAIVYMFEQGHLWTSSVVKTLKQLQLHVLK